MKADCFNARDEPESESGVEGVDEEELFHDDDGVLEGYITVPLPSGFMTFLSRRGIAAVSICSIVSGCMT